MPNKLKILLSLKGLLPQNQFYPKINGKVETPNAGLRVRQTMNTLAPPQRETRRSILRFFARYMTTASKYLKPALELEITRLFQTIKLFSI
jgi:hypothetical protein